MEMKLTRRRFGQLAIATTAAAGLGYFANKTFAQDAPTVIFGARSERRKFFKRVTVQALDLGTNTINENVATTSLLEGEQLVDFTSLADGRLVLALGPARAAGKIQNAATRLVFLDTDRTTLTVSGLTSKQTIDSIVGLPDGSLAALVQRKNRRPPVSLGLISLTTGQFSLTNRINLPNTERFSNLATSNGLLYSTVVRRGGETNVVQLDFGRRRPIILEQLNVRDRPWLSGTSSLAGSSSQLFSLCARRYAAFFNLYTLNPNNGDLNLIRESWPVMKIAIPPTSV